MPDISALYPAPPPPQQGGALSSIAQNPLAIIPALSALQQMQITRQQAPALVQQPAAALAGQNIQNLAAEMQQQDAARRIIAAEIGAGISGMDKPTANDVHSLTAYAARSHPDIAARYPGIINSAADLVLKHPQGIKYGANVLLNSGMSPEGASSRTNVIDPRTGAAGTIPVTAANLRGALPTSLAPGVGEAATQAGGRSGQLLAEDRAAGAQFRQQTFPLEKAIPALESLGKTGTGPGTEQLNQVKSFLQSAGVPGFDAEKIKNFDEANKYLTDFVNQNGNTATNDKLAAAFAGNPSVHISNAAAVDVAKSALALRRMRHAQVVAFEQTGLPDSQYASWALKWQLQQDPRAYGFDMMSAKNRQAVINELGAGQNGPANIERFKNSLTTAEQTLGITMK